MAVDYAKCAREIFEILGGRSNLVSAAHCATRLRLVTVDNSKIDMKKLENIDGVKGVFSNNGQLQLIIGTGTVNKVYDETRRAALRGNSFFPLRPPYARIRRTFLLPLSAKP